MTRRRIGLNKFRSAFAHDSFSHIDRVRLIAAQPNAWRGGGRRSRKLRIAYILNEC